MVWKVAGVVLMALACAVVFAAYLRPDMVITYASAFAALCGF